LSTRELKTAGTALLAAALMLTAAACGGGSDSNSTGGEAEPSPVRTATPEVEPTGDQALYLALGDSLSEGIGATDRARTAWVPLVAEGLGDEYELVNLGVAGHDSRELIEEGPLDEAVREIDARESDGVEGNEVAVITLEIGGNDLLDLYFDLVLPGICPTVAEGLQRRMCVAELESALGGYTPNLEEILDTLQAAAPGVPIFLMTLYNPFSGGSYNLEQIGILALEGMADTPFPGGLNDEIREQAEGREGVHLVEWYEPFLGKQSEYISLDFIHPNDAGHRVMAEALLSRMGEAGLP
jgi:lysophospholipase L1-like esterase